MFEFMTTIAVIGALCWAGKQALAVYERQKTVARVERMARDSREHGEYINPVEVEQVAKQLCAPTESQKKGVSPWLVLLGCIVYIICPIDFLPDFIPVVGWVDDLAAGGIGIKALIDGLNRS